MLCVAHTYAYSHTRIHKHKWHKFSLPWWILKNICHFVFHPVRTFSQKWKIGRLFIIIAAFFFVVVGCRLVSSSLYWFSHSVFFLLFIVHFQFHTLFESHICLFVGVVIVLLPLLHSLNYILSRNFLCMADIFMYTQYQCGTFLPFYASIFATAISIQNVSMTRQYSSNANAYIYMSLYRRFRLRQV